VGDEGLAVEEVRLARVGATQLEILHIKARCMNLTHTFWPPCRGIALLIEIITFLTSQGPFFFRVCIFTMPRIVALLGDEDTEFPSLKFAETR
jgi:hypothetical protein